MQLMYLIDDILLITALDFLIAMLYGLYLKLMIYFDFFH